MSSRGLETLPAGTLVDRAMTLIGNGPADSVEIATEVLGIGRAPKIVFERLATALLGSDPRIRRLPDGRWDLVRTVGRSPRLNDCAFAVVDVETTGSRAGGTDKITEIAVVVLHGGTIEVVLDTLVNPERPIPSVVTSITGITQRDVRNKPVFDEIADDVMGALAGRVFVAHNMQFDWSFLSRSIRRSRDVILDGPQLCTVRLSKKLIPGLKSRSLDSVSTYFGIEIENRHRAGPDAIATAKVLRRLLPLAEEQGVRTLADLERLGRARAPRKRRRRRAAPQPLNEI